jgi:hypothetical protein
MLLVLPGLHPAWMLRFPYYEWRQLKGMWDDPRKPL